MKSILHKPVITEKSLKDASGGVYTFYVDLGARKEAIRKAIQEMFAVHVISIKTIILKGKTKKVGKKRVVVKSADIKKAKVCLRKGEKIALFETQESK